MRLFRSFLAISSLITLHAIMPLLLSMRPDQLVVSRGVV